jgi:hypothetical protein
MKRYQEAAMNPVNITRKTVVRCAAIVAVLASLALPVLAQQDVDPTYYPFQDAAKPAARQAAKTQPKKTATKARARSKKNVEMARLNRDNGPVSGTK